MLRSSIRRHQTSGPYQGGVIGGQQLALSAATGVSSAAATVVAGTGGGGQTPQPNLSAAYLSSIGVTVRSYLGDYADITTKYWDSGVGGTYAHGSANGVTGLTTTPNPNLFMDSAGIRHLRTRGPNDPTHPNTSVWCTMQPGSAQVGLILPAACIVESHIAIVGPSTGSNDLPPYAAGGPDSTHSYAWVGPYTQNPNASIANNNYQEVDIMEAAGWSGATGNGTMTYHVDGNNAHNSPDTFSPNPLFPIADGNYHTYAMIKKGTAGAGMYIAWDGSQIVSTTVQGSYQYIMMFTGGFTSWGFGRTGAPLYVDELLKHLYIWSI